MMASQFIFINSVILWACIYISILHGKPTEHLVIQVNGNETTVHQLEKDYCLKYIRKVFKDDNFYHFKTNFTTKGPINRLLSRMKNDTKIIWVEHQVKRSREIRRISKKHNFYRSFEEETDNINPSEEIHFNDPYYPDQWYLHNEGQTGGIPGNDLNVVAAWKAGYTGKGVVLSVLDDGIQHTNLDIQQNYESSISYDLVDLEDEKHDPTPDLNGDNSHGTYCAAIIAAVANNRICGVGIAYNAKVGGSNRENFTFGKWQDYILSGLRLMDGKVSDLQEAMALTFGVDKVDIYSASWGPRDDGKHMAGPGKLTTRALKEGIRKGRQGKGVVYVWAVGNGGLKKDNCNMDGYVTSIYTIAVSALTSEGLSAYYSEPCASTLASTFVGGLHKPSVRHISSIFKDMKTVKVVVPELDGTCSETFQGTSAAAPLAAGVIALSIEANPSLTWRDIQHILVHSSRIPNANESDWKINGAGHHFHLSYGFGVMDAAQMVAKARTWQLVNPQRKFTINSAKMPRNIYCNRNVTSSIENTDKIMDVSQRVTHIEHVLITVDIVHPSRGHLSVILQSPSGTISQQLTQRPWDDSRKGIRMWNFMSVHFWDENPVGRWILTISDHSSCHGKLGVLKHFSLTFYGTYNDNQDEKRTLRGQKTAFVPNQEMLKRIVKQEKLKSKSINIAKNWEDDLF